MMHGHEKSDLVIVVMKPANKADPETVSAAESVERRTGAEGFHSLEGNMCGTAMRGADALPGCLRPHHVQRDRIGTWEISCLTVSVA